jgi:hypothetical protein
VDVLTGAELTTAVRGEIAQTVAGWTQEAAKRGEAILPQTAKTVEHQLAGGLAVLLVEQGMPIGFLTTYALGVDDQAMRWWEVGTGIAPPEERGRGLGTILYTQVARMHPRDFLVCTTKNPVALHLSVKAGFCVVSFAVVPLVIREGLCVRTTCWQPCSSGRCKSEHNLGGPCYARLRVPQ